MHSRGVVAVRPCEAAGSGLPDNDPEFPVPTDKASHISEIPRYRRKVKPVLSLLLCKNFYIISGKGFYKIGKRTYELQAGDSFLVYPNTEVVYYAAVSPV